MFKTNMGGGWHSDINLHQHDHPALKQLFGHVLNTAEQVTREIYPDVGEIRPEDWRMESWINSNGRDAYNAWHDHSSYYQDHSNIWAGVYYVDNGAPDGDIPPEGEIVFRDDFLGPQKEVATPVRPMRTVEFAAEAGKFFIFPAWLRHHVKPYKGVGERVSLAFNLAHPAIDVDINPRYRRLPLAWKMFPGLMKRLRRVSPVEL
ncbi:putative 2OG-Fe(II) oxygenase [Emcibacter sp.]|uniref:putative 2OG-Fe(II) oxygenase n=1 Tax=Emcibacter sp. TaxID=1979954 RepID=UPI003A8CBC6B